jgi:hypothetical protein
MRPSKIRVAKYEHSATSKWVVEGLKNNKGKRSRKFFRSRIEADDFARNVLEEQRQYGQKAQHLPHKLRLSAIQCAEKLSLYGKSLEDATESLLERLRVSQTLLQPKQACVGVSGEQTRQRPQPTPSSRS